MSRFLDDAYMAWLASALSCCGTSGRTAPRRGVEKPMRIEHHQPRLIPPPIPEEQERPTTRGREWVHRTRSFASRASSRGSFSVRRQVNAYNGPRRPRIGAPQDFRHVDDAIPMPSRRKEGFRPLELSIYMPENQLSPLLPHFGVDALEFPRDEEKDLPFPPTAITHSRSGSALSFRVPRKPLRSTSGSSSQWTANFKPRPDSLSAQELLAALEHDLPRAPPPARLRSMTEPPAYERVKSALHEKFELEQRLRDIDVIIEERKSFYLNSRPTSRAASRPTSIYEESEEPMPSALAPLHTSFAARASSPRPKTAPSRPVHIPTRLTSFTEASLAFTSHPPSPYEGRLPSDLPPPPPLPLILQAPPSHPPLRKKKSFSRVSKWLFPSGDGETDEEKHGRTISMDTVTNTPKPVTSREGFYQCIELHQRSSTRNSVSTVSSLGSELDEPTAPTSWAGATPDGSPGGGAARKFDVLIQTLEMDGRESEELVRARTFGEREEGEGKKWRMEMGVVPVKGHVPGRNSVGVAF